MPRLFSLGACTLAILVAFPVECLGEEIVVSLSVVPEVQPDRRVVVTGKTDLPAETSLMVSIDDALTDQVRGQSKTAVQADGNFESEALGPVTGRPPTWTVALWNKP